MSYRIALSSATLEVLRDLLNRPLRAAVLARIGALAEEPEAQGVRLTGALRGLLSLRGEGGWLRLVYRVEGDQVQVLGAAIGGASAGGRDVRALARKLFRQRLLEAE